MFSFLCLLIKCWSNSGLISKKFLVDQDNHEALLTHVFEGSVISSYGENMQ